MKLKKSELSAVFLAAFSSLLFEITVTRIFSFTLWANYAYLVISTAMFGLGFAGVVMTRWPGLFKLRESPFYAGNMILCAASMFGALFVMNYVPIHLPDAYFGWARESRNVAIVFLTLSLPFFFFGLMISAVLEQRGRQANIYYCADLLGAGLGAFALVPLIPTLEPQGLIALCTLLAIGSAVLFLSAGAGRPLTKFILPGVCGVLIAAAVVVVTPIVHNHIPLVVHVHKRSFDKDISQGRLEKTGWSALSRVDIAVMPWDPNSRKRVWIDGGVNESSIVRFEGDYPSLLAGRDGVIKVAESILDYKALPHLSKTNHTVCVIGTSGGEDSLYTLMMGASHVVGVEMDPTIVNFVTKDYRDFAGGLFVDGKYSEIIVDEGRSYLQRCGRKFDVIQQVNNFTPIAFQNGALNLSECYLLTVESFKAFYDSLSDDGILSISRYGSIRMMSIAVEMFRRMGMKPEEYSKHLFACEGPAWVINTFMMKKSAFTPGEIDRLFQFFKAAPHGRSILYAPYRTQDLPDIENNLYYKLATAPDPSVYWQQGCFTFAPTTDSMPFFNNFKTLGKQDRFREKLKFLPGEVIQMEARNKLDKRVPVGFLPPIILLIEAIVLSSVFFGLPLLSKRELRDALKVNRRALGFFACLGIAFISIEICLIQRLVLFLGSPVYSITVVLSSLLVFAGLGSFASGLFNPSVRTIRRLMIGVALVVLALHFLMPVMTSTFLGSALPIRMLIAIVFTGVAGFIMGMPMPTGIRLLKETGENIIPWAWAMNGFFTVIGSAGSVLVASTLGFPAVFFMATIIYAVSPLFFKERAAV